MFFGSDNGAGACPEVLNAVIAANSGFSLAYGNEEMARLAEQEINRVFERNVSSFLVSTGTAANALALSAITAPFGVTLTHEQSHVLEDECGAIEFYGNSSRLIGIEGLGGKISPQELTAKLKKVPRRLPHAMPLKGLSLTQASESGLCYSAQELSELCKIAHDAGLKVHMDGARFGQAVASLNVSAAEISWKAGVDVLSFGATKGGAIACEAVIFFDETLAQDFAFKRKRGGHLFSKHRFLSAQMLAFLKDDVWLKNAHHANAMAQKMALSLTKKGVRLGYNVQANEVFPVLTEAQDKRLKEKGAVYYPWSGRGLQCAPPAQDEHLVRLVMSYATTDEMVQAFLNEI
jgi:threonine aldolase